MQVLANARLVVERMALPSSEQFEWLARQHLRPIDLVESLISTLRAAMFEFGDHLSPTLRLRLEALDGELRSLSLSQDPPETPDELLQHSNWAAATHLAADALGEAGWPSP
jgi:hypothetical protein